MAGHFSDILITSSAAMLFRDSKLDEFLNIYFVLSKININIDLVIPGDDDDDDDDNDDDDGGGGEC